MKSKPVVMEHLYIETADFIVDFTLKNNLILVTGNAGSGKSLAFRVIRDSEELKSRVVCLDSNGHHQEILEVIMQCQGKLIFVDHADIILNDSARKYISIDGANQYILIGRNPNNLFATRSNIYEIHQEHVGSKICFMMEPPVSRN